MSLQSYSGPSSIVAGAGVAHAASVYGPTSSHRADQSEGHQYREVDQVQAKTFNASLLFCLYVADEVM